MGLYKCSACGYKSSYQTNVIKHITKKKKCSDKVEPMLIKVDEKIECNYCGKSLSHITSLNNHLMVCKERKLLELNNNNEIKELKNKVKKLEKKLNKTLTKVTTVNSHNTNTNTVNINLTAYNNPNAECMSKLIEIALKKIFLCVPNLIQNLHFNKDYPENHNICITNKRTKDAKVFNGDIWKTTPKSILIQEIFDSYEREIIDYAEEKGRTRFLNQYEEAKKRGDADKDLERIIHDMIYDNSHMVNTKILNVRKPQRTQTLGHTEEEEEDEEESEESGDSEESDTEVKNEKLKDLDESNESDDSDDSDGFNELENIN